MSQVQAFTVGEKTYNAVMASAVKQDELLSMLTATLLDRSLAAASAGQVLDDSVVGPMMMGMPYATKVKVASIIMHKVLINGTEIPVTIDDFSGRMVEYNQLLAKLLMWNLGDFSSWLRSALPVGVTQPQAQEEKPAQ
jgi:hypothetical protein